MSLTAAKSGEIILDPWPEAFTHCNRAAVVAMSLPPHHLVHSISGLELLVSRWTTVTPYTLTKGSTSTLLTPTTGWTLAALFGSNSSSISISKISSSLKAPSSNLPSGRVWGKAPYLPDALRPLRCRRSPFDHGLILACFVYHLTIQP